VADADVLAMLAGQLVDSRNYEELLRGGDRIRLNCTREVSNQK
jgi:hypothetical protein